MKTLETILDLMKTKSSAIETWFKTQWSGLKPPPYFSCDLRHSEKKIGIVDTNLFPGGFNNLCKAFSKITAEAFQNYFETYYPQVKNIAILSESHTRNKFYLLNILKLKSLLEQAGKNVRTTMILPNWPQDEIKLPLSEAETLDLHKPRVQNGELFLGNFKADLILTNNDFSSGFPPELSSLQTTMVPPESLGWHKRKKSQHFCILNELIEDFSQTFAFDCWLLTPYSTVITNLPENDMTELAQKIDEMILRIKNKYREYQISEEPYVFVKNDAGTYGLGVVHVKTGKELLELNRKSRQKLLATKGKNKNYSFLIQEGIPTYDTYSSFPIEPVIYGVGKRAIGGFFRIHKDKDPFESLNAPGMDFSCLCLHKLDEPHEAFYIKCEEKEKLVTVSRFLARFASLAAAKELK